MTQDTLYRALHDIAAGNFSHFEKAAQPIYQALRDHNGELLTSVYKQLMDEGSHQAVTTFDSLMDMFCTEPLTINTSDDAEAWRTVALTVFLKQPASLLVAKLGDMSAFEATLATKLGLSKDAVKCDPLPLPSWVSFDFGPLEAFNQCRATKVWAEGHLDKDPRRGLNNIWIGDGKAQRVQESVFLVALRCRESQMRGILALLRDFVQSREAYELEAPIKDEAPVPVKAMVVDAGVPWTVFNDALHSLDVYQLGGALRMLSKQEGLQMREMSLVGAFVQEEGENNHTLRVSVLKKGTKKLLGGVLFYDLHQPELFIAKANELLEAFQADPITVLDKHVRDVEIEQSGDMAPRFYVPELGWHITVSVF